MKIKIRKVKLSDLEWIKNLWRRNWGGGFIISRGKIHKPEKLNGFVAEIEKKKVGLITFEIKNKELEIISLDSFLKRKGVGSELVKKVLEFAKRKKIKKVWLITTNDNLEGLKFWQKRGFCLAKVYPLTIDKISRKIKSEIPKIGAFGIPIRDEIKLEIKI